MRHFLGVVSVVAMSCGVATMAAGQDGKRPAPPDRMLETARQHSASERMMPEPAVHLERLAKGLELNDQQRQQIRPILEDEFARLKKIRRNEDLSPKQIQKQVEALRNETITKVRQCLTPAQQEKYDVISAEIKSNKQQRMKENRRERIGTRATPPAQ